jgi:hypothetical protein
LVVAVASRPKGACLPHILEPIHGRGDLGLRRPEMLLRMSLVRRCGLCVPTVAGCHIVQEKSVRRSTCIQQPSRLSSDEFGALPTGQ